MKKGNIILINGVSSSGKSTVAKELLKKLENYFHFSIDEFDHIINVMEERDKEGGRLIPVATELFFHDNIKMFSDYGINLIVDQILHNQETTEDLLTKLHDYPVLFVGVHCSEAELERRELQRGDRPVGQGKSQLQYVHQQNEVYDVEVNTETQSMLECVEIILDTLENMKNPKGMGRTFEIWRENQVAIESIKN
jgi:chloramphenicol 3-O phosphotransferase